MPMNDNVVRLDLGLSNTIDDESKHESAGYYFHTDELTQLRQALVRSMLEPMVVNVVVGDQGSGKTVLLEQLLQQSDSGWSLCLIQANHALGAQHILDQLNNRYFPQQAYTLHELADHFLLQEKSTIPVILVDDAHKLSSFALEVLLYLKHALEEQDRRCGIVLFAGPEIRQLLTSHSLTRYDESPRIIDLPLFSQAQTSQYIQQLMTNSGIDGRFSLSPAQQLTIYRRSQGRAGRINELLTHIMRQQINGTIWSWLNRLLKKHQRHLLMTGVLLVIMIAVSSKFVYYDPAAVVATVEVAVESANTLGSQQQVTEVVSSELHSVADSSTASSGSQADVTPLKADRKLPHQLPPSEPQKKNNVVTTMNTVNAAASAPAGAQTQAEKPAASLPQPESPLPVEQQTVVAQLGERTKPVAGEAWLMAQAGNAYTVQLAASSYGQAIERFIGQQPALDELRYVKVNRRGEDWYVVLYGAYSTVSAAKKAIDSLPPTLSKNDPWVRRISRLQEMLPQATQRPAIVPSVMESVETDAPAITQSPPRFLPESQTQPDEELPVPSDESAPATGDNAGAKSVADDTVQPVAGSQVPGIVAGETKPATLPRL